MAQKGQSNPQQPNKPMPTKDPQDPNRRAQPGRESYRDPDEQKPEREIPKRADREQDEETDE
jgi:hypothetical protein